MMRRLAFCCLLLSSTGHAASIYWDGSSSSTWADVANWSTVSAGGTDPAAVPAAGDRAYFNADTFTQTISTLGAAQAADGLVFNAGASGGTILGTLDDYLLTLGAQGILVESGTQLINSSIAVGSVETWSNTGAGTLTVAGGVALASNLTLGGTGGISLSGLVTSTTSRTLTVTNTSGNVVLGDVSNTATLTFNTAAGAILAINGVVSGSSIHKDGVGTLIFNGANTFGGNVRIIEGTLKVNASNASTPQLIFGNASGAAGSDGFGTLTLDTNSAVAFRLANLTYVHPTSDGAVINSSGGGSFTPTLALYGDRTFIVNDTASANDLVVEVGIANGDTSTSGITKQSIGVMVMRGVNTYTGATNVDRGTLALDYSVNNSDSRLSDTAATSLRGGTLALWGNATAAASETIGSLAMVRANSTVALQSNGEMVTLNIAGGLARTTGSGVVNFSFNDLSKTQVFASGGAANNAYGILGGWATVNGSRWAAKDGSGQIVPVAGTVQNNRSLWAAADHVVIDGAAAGTLGTGEIASLIIGSPAGGTVALNNAGSALTLAAGAILVSSDVGSSATAISGGQLLSKQSAGGQSAEMIVTNLSAGTLTISANFGATNTPQSLLAQHLTLAGPGLIVLAGSNNLMGHAAIGSGSLTSQVNIQGQVRVSGGNGLTDYGSVVLAGGAAMTVGALLDINGGTEGVGNLSGGAGGDNTYAEVGRGEVRLGSGGVLTLNQTANSTLSAQITGTNALLIKKGSATFTTTTTVEHTMTGEVRVLGGLLDLTGGSAGFTSAGTLRLRGGQIRVEQNQTGSTTVNKVNNNAAVILEGTSGDGYRITSNQNAARTETAASLALAGGASTVTLDNTASSTGSAVTAFAFGGATSFSRSNGATLLARGPNLGGTASASTEATRVVFTNATAVNSYLIGTSTAAGSTNLKILPFAIGENSPAGAGNTFLTVDSTAGNSLRTLADTEYSASYAAAAADANLSLDAAAADLGAKTLNALRIISSAGSVSLAGSAGSTLVLTSGGLLAAAGATDNDVTISGYDSIMAGAAGVGDDELVVHVTSSHAAPAGATLTLQSAIVDNGGATSLTKAGAGTLVLSGANTYTGATTVNQGVLEFGASAGNLGSGVVRVSGGTLRWGAGNATDITAGGRTVELLGASVYLTPNFGGYVLETGSTFDVGASNVTLANAVGGSGYGGLTKLGTGTLTLSAAPTYRGATVVSQGALNFASIAPNTTEALYLIQTASVASGAISSTIQNGLNLQSLVVGGVYNSGPNVTATLTVQGGAVSIGDGGGDDFMLIGYRDPTATQATTGSTRGTVDFSAASSVTINVSQIQMGVYNGAIPSPNSLTTTGSLTLSGGANVITASSILMGSSPTSVVNTGTASTMNLGSGATTINVDTFVVGGIRSKADVTIGAGGSVTLRGQQGGSTGANLFIGDNDVSGTGTPNASTFNLAGAANVDMRLNLLVLGRLGSSVNNGYGRGTLAYAVGAIVADTIRMAEANYTSAGTNPQNTQGTLTQSGSASMRFRHLSQGDGTATYNWQGGTIGNVAETNLTNQNVTLTLNGSGSATDTSLRTFDVDAGQTATFEAEAEMAGSGSFTKAGQGELIYKGVNTSTGNVRIASGKVSLAANGSMDDAAWVNVESGASFDISQRTGAAYTSDAVISGSGAIGGAGSTFTVGSSIGSAASVGVLRPGGSSVLNSAASAASVGDQAGTLSITGNLILAASGGARVDRAVLQVGATDRNASSTFFTTYGGNVTTWVDNIPADFASFMTGSGSGHDRLDIAGTLTLNNTGGISVALNGGYTGVFGDVFNLMDWSALDNTNGFTAGGRIRTGGETELDLMLPTLAAGLAWDTSMFQSYGVVVVVPEPGRAVLLLLAGSALACRRRRR